MKPARRRKMVDGGHPSLSIVRQCALVGVSRSSLYYPPQRASEEELSLMAEIDRQYLQTPFYGSRRMKAWLEQQGILLSRKRVQRPMPVTGVRAIYGGPEPANRRREYGSIPICWGRPKSPDPTVSGGTKVDHVGR